MLSWAGNHDRDVTVMTVTTAHSTAVSAQNSVLSHPHPRAQADASVKVLTRLPGRARWPLHMIQSLPAQVGETAVIA